MKLVLSLMFLLCGTAAIASDDQYLYWQIAWDEKFLQPDVSYMAKIRGYTRGGISLENRGGFMSLFSDTGANLGTSVKFTNDSEFLGVQAFAKMASNPEYASYVVELFNDSNSDGKYEWYGQATLAWDENNIAYWGGEGLAHPAEPARASGFSETPEPTSGVLILIGVAGLALRRRRMQKV